MPQEKKAKSNEIIEEATDRLAWLFVEYVDQKNRDKSNENKNYENRRKI